MVYFISPAFSVFGFDFVNMKGLAALIIVDIGSANKLVKTRVTRTTQNDM